jgi:hypothetical protein
MINLQDKVWYACYGSNLLEERFLCYIKGGRPEGAETNYKGCSDSSEPTESEEFYICSELYFAKNSSSWNGGVAFIRTHFEPEASTLARMYLITKGQFVDVARQETKTESKLNLDFDLAIKDGSFIFKQRSWYGNIVYLGEQNGYPIFTLTNESDLQPLTKPSHNYLKTIIKGIKEAHDFDDKTIFDYLKTKKGIAGNYDNEELSKLFISLK